MLTATETATIRAALRYWIDEIISGGDALAQLYFDTDIDRGLDAEAIEQLIARLKPDSLRLIGVDQINLDSMLTDLDSVEIQDTGKFHTVIPARDPGTET